MKKPRPFSAGFHHQPLSGWFASGAAPRLLPTSGWRSIGTVPPGQIIVPCDASANASVMAPLVETWGRPGYAPPSVCPPLTFSRSPEKSDPSSEVAPDATFHVERPDAS